MYFSELFWKEIPSVFCRSLKFVLYELVVVEYDLGFSFLEGCILLSMQKQQYKTSLSVFHFPDNSPIIIILL